MTKIRTATFLMAVVSTCALILSFTDAYPTTEVPTESNTTADITGNSNNTALQFAITHVVKTIEFQVGVLQEDDADSGNATDVTTQEYIETEIKLLNVNLLKELLARATADEAESTTKTVEEEDERDSVGEIKLKN